VGWKVATETGQAQRCQGRTQLHPPGPSRALPLRTVGIAAWLYLDSKIEIAILLSMQSVEALQQVWVAILIFAA
jgi:hypothetical protein